MKIIPTEIPDVLLFEPVVHGDSRGFFMETWRASHFTERGIEARFVQDNHSRSACGVLRGLHYQLRHPQGKLLRVLSGAVFDVAVDIRRASPTFGKWVGVTLDAARHRQLWVPPGFAHGYCVTSAEGAEIAYKCTNYHHPEDEHCLRWDDPALAIDWPIDGAPVLSDKDAAAPLLQDAEIFP